MPAQKDFSISRQKRLSMSAMRLCVTGAQSSFWRSNKFLLLVAWSKALRFWREPKINSRSYWRCVLSCQVLVQQRERQVSWRLCNNSEIHLWFWKLWSWLFVHKVPFMLQEHVKTRKTDETRFFFAKKMSCVPNKQLLLNVPVKSTNYRKKKFCASNKVQETIGDV